MERSIYVDLSKIYPSVWLIPSWKMNLSLIMIESWSDSGSQNEDQDPAKIWSWLTNTPPFNLTRMPRQGKLITKGSPILQSFVDLLLIMRVKEESSRKLKSLATTSKQAIGITYTKYDQNCRILKNMYVYILIHLSNKSCRRHAITDKE